MQKRVIWLVLVTLIIFSIVLLSCSSSTTSTSTSSTTSVSSSSSSAVSTTSVTTAAPAQWWDKFGQPTYGGKISRQVSNILGNFDPGLPAGGQYFGYEHMLMHDWTLDRAIFSFKGGWTPFDYWVGHLVESWEWVDDQTMIAHVRHGVHWQDKSPVNGREFVADDIQHHYDRIFATGHGYTEKNPFLSLWGAGISKVIATDDYTVRFEFKAPTLFMNNSTIMDVSSLNIIECPEVVAAGIDDWKNAAGTGAFMISDYIANASLTYSRNPNYWGYDERHPQNQLPYLDEFTNIVISDTTTALAAMRTGKIDLMAGVTWTNSDILRDSNPEIVQSEVLGNTSAVSLRCDKEPFIDIRVRQALQMSIDRKSLAATIYGGKVSGEPIGLFNTIYGGWYTPYEQWPADLKEIYSYNPEKAKQLLAEAGYPDGFTTNIVTGSTNTELVQAIKAMFKDIGVDMEIRTMEGQALTEYVYAKKHDQMTMAGVGKADPPQIRVADLVSDQRSNTTMNNDATYDAYYQKLLAANTTEEAKQICIDTEMYAVEQNWLVIICPSNTYDVWQPSVHGFSGEQLDWTLDWGMARIWKIKE